MLTFTSDREKENKCVSAKSQINKLIKNNRNKRWYQLLERCTTIRYWHCMSSCPKVLFFLVQVWFMFRHVPRISVRVWFDILNWNLVVQQHIQKNGSSIHILLFLNFRSFNLPFLNFSFFQTEHTTQVVSCSLLILFWWYFSYFKTFIVLFCIAVNVVVHQSWHIVL